MTFRVGQRVVCVDDKPTPGRIFEPGVRLSKGAIYTVAAIRRTHFNEPGVILAEVNRIGGLSFRVARFRPLIERKTDISIFTDILDGVNKTRVLEDCQDEHPAGSISHTGSTRDERQETSRGKGDSAGLLDKPTREPSTNVRPSLKYKQAAA